VELCQELQILDFLLPVLHGVFVQHCTSHSYRRESY
jgi:hypothetical protein